MSKKINIDIWRFIVSFLIVAIHISPFDLPHILHD